MYMNSYQQYIKELLDEYDALLKRQLLQMINIKFNVNKTSIDRYISQMCIYSDYEVINIGIEDAMSKKGKLPNYDIIRSFDVLLAFMPKVIHHRKSKDFVSIAFIIETDERDKQFFIVPVKTGYERRISLFANDKFDKEKCEIVIFLLESREQIHAIHTVCNHKFAVIEKDGVKFLKLNN